MSRFGGAPKCAACGKTAYATEQIIADDKVFHKAGCFKCTHCQKSLSPGNYAGMGGVYYCKPHFKQLFALKGNYDEGFGKTQHKTNWAPNTSGFEGNQADTTAPSKVAHVQAGDKPEAPAEEEHHHEEHAEEHVHEEAPAEEVHEEAAAQEEVAAE